MRRKHPRLVIVAAAVLVASAVIIPSSLAAGIRQGSDDDDADDADPAVITTWNSIAERTIFAENSTPAPASGLYFAYVSIAVYDAVVAINGRYEPYLKQPRVEARASKEAAAATAAYRVLSRYFPASAKRLEADYAHTLNDIPDGPVKDRGQQAGAAAADSLIAARRDDGRGLPVTLDVTPGPGKWRSTPDAYAPMRVPWLGFVRPLALKSPTQAGLPGPDKLTSRDYTRDFAEVKERGGSHASGRTAARTETALFWSADPVAQYQQALRDQISRRGMDITTSARAFALLGTSTADALIACWRAKYNHASWRPVTAIRLADTDGNDATTADPEWTPLIATPPDPEYVSAHACVTGATTETFRRLFGARSVDLSISSPVTATTRHYDTAVAVDDETKNAQIWQGLQFRQGVDDGNRLGHRVASWTATHEFRGG